MIAIINSSTARSAFTNSHHTTLNMQIKRFAACMQIYIISVIERRRILSEISSFTCLRLKRISGHVLEHFPALITCFTICSIDLCSLAFPLKQKAGARRLEDMQLRCFRVCIVLIICTKNRKGKQTVLLDETSTLLEISSGENWTFVCVSFVKGASDLFGLFCSFSFIFLWRKVK